MVAAVLGQSGAAGFDCASVPEIQLALQSTAGPSSTTNKAQQGNNKLCVYANPQRAEKDLDTALALSVRALTFDGPEELRKVHRAYQKQVEQQQQTSNNKDDNNMVARPDLILRIVVPDEHSSVPLGEKFGASPSRFLSLIELAVELGLRIVGVSFHCGSGNHDPTAYQVAIELAGEAMEIVDRVQQQAGIEDKCWLLDIGGGYPGRDGIGGDCGRFVGSDSQESATGDEPVDDATQDSDTTIKIANIVTPLLDELYPVDSSHVQVISEPGRYFVEGAFALCSRIYRVVVEPESAHRHYYIAQGVQGVFKDCVLCGESFLPIPLALESPSDGEGDPSVVPSTVHGPSGEDYDIICRDYPLPVLQTGDWLIFDRMGAYTLSIAARNGRPPVRYLMGGSTLSIK
jgi:ornithine decarboxylase